MRIARAKTSFSFFVRGLVFKERAKPNYGKRIMYTPRSTKAWEEEIAWLAKGAMLENNITEPFLAGVKVEILAFCVKPLSKPDEDNISKIVKDALQGVAYKNDSQVVDCYIRKASLMDWEFIEVPKSLTSGVRGRMQLDRGEGIFIIVEDLKDKDPVKHRQELQNFINRFYEVEDTSYSSKLTKNHCKSYLRFIDVGSRI